jgi:RNA polymerase sigma-70 factor (ECF subfamily)
LLSSVPPATPDFRALFDQQVDFVWRVLRRYGVPERELEDVCQEVFMVVHRKLPEFEARSSLRTWIYAIASRVALVSRRKAYFRREQLEAETREVHQDATQEERTAQKRALSLVECALAELDPEKREAFVLYELEGMSVVEVAQAVGVPENTALYRLHRARRAGAEAQASGVRVRGATTDRTRGGRTGPMTERRDPPRWLESGFLPEEIAHDLAAYAGEAPLPARKAQMFERLAAQLGEPVQPVQAPRSGSMLDLKLLLGSAALLAGLVGLWQWQAATLPPARLASLEPDAPSALRIAPLAPRLVAETPAPRVEPVNIAPRRPARVHAQPRPVVEAPTPARPDALAELTLLARARRALLNDPQRALALCDEHSSSYPDGAFAEEREVLAIESLLKLARVESARTRALAFEVGFPRSAHLAHLAKLIAKPSP